MPPAKTTTAREGRQLVPGSLVDAARDELSRAWTGPDPGCHEGRQCTEQLAERVARM